MQPRCESRPDHRSARRASDRSSGIGTAAGGACGRCAAAAGAACRRSCWCRSWRGSLAESQADWPVKLLARHWTRLARTPTGETTTKTSRILIRASNMTTIRPPIAPAIWGGHGSPIRTSMMSSLTCAPTTSATRAVPNLVGTAPGMHHAPRGTAGRVRVRHRRRAGMPTVTACDWNNALAFPAGARHFTTVTARRVPASRKILRTIAEGDLIDPRRRDVKTALRRGFVFTGDFSHERDPARWS